MMYKHDGIWTLSLYHGKGGGAVEGIVLNGKGSAKLRIVLPVRLLMEIIQEEG